MINNVGCIGVGKQFRYGDNTYVRTPEMILECNGCEFVTNCMRVSRHNGMEPPDIMAEYFLPETIVTLVALV